MARPVHDAKRIVHAVLRRFGYDIVRWDDPANLLTRTLAEHDVTLVLDIGANDGAYVRTLLRAGGYGGRVISFEPLSDAFERMAKAAASDPAWECRRHALGARAGAAELNVAGNSSSSSLLPMTQRHVDGAPESAYTGTERVDVLTLDSLRGDLWRPGERIFLKLDVQGYELQVLEGASETLRDVHVIQCELSLAPLYEGQALLPELADFFERAGFALVSLDSVFREPQSGKLLQVDGLFARLPTGR